jgi:hypothetical protein
MQPYLRKQRPLEIKVCLMKDVWQAYMEDARKTSERLA